MEWLIWNNLIFSIFSVIWFIILIYWYSFFWKYAISEYTEYINKITLLRFLKEYFFYVIFFILSLFLWIFISWGENYSIIYFVVVLLWLLTYIIDFNNVFSWKKKDIKNSKIEIWMLKISPIWNKNQWIWFDLIIKGILWIIITIFLSYILFQNNNTFYVWLTAPIIYATLFWISYTDKSKKIILERFLIVILISWIVLNIIFFSFFIENLILLFTFSWLTLFVIWIINKLKNQDILGYMDFPVIFAIWLNMFFYSIIFIVLLLTYTWIEWFYEKFIRKNNDTWFSVGLFWSADISFIITLIIIILFFN